MGTPQEKGKLFHSRWLDVGPVASWNFGANRLLASSAFAGLGSSLQANPSGGRAGTSGRTVAAYGSLGAIGLGGKLFSIFFPELQLTSLFWAWWVQVLKSFSVRRRIRRGNYLLTSTYQMHELRQSCASPTKCNQPRRERLAACRADILWPK